MDTSTVEILTLEDVWKRVPLLRRILRDVVDCHTARRQAKEFLDELSVISKKFSSGEITETMNRLRRDIVAADRAMDGFQKEIRNLGGFLKDPIKGLAYFYSERDGRKIFLNWELGEPDLVTWHELDESFSDRLPVDEWPESTEASLLDSQGE